MLAATRWRQCNLEHFCKKRTVCKVRQSRLAILRKIKREATPHTNQTQVASHFILPQRTKDRHEPKIKSLHLPLQEQH